MTNTDFKKITIENRIALLQSRTTDNKAIIAKLQRKLRKLI